jgi:hypothetical protein
MLLNSMWCIIKLTYSFEGARQTADGRRQKTKGKRQKAEGRKYKMRLNLPLQWRGSGGGPETGNW